MKQFTLPLHDDAQRPTVNLVKFHKINAMLDTGSLFPVWVRDEAKMFSGLIYEVDDHNHRFNVTIPDRESHVRKLTIEDRNGVLHVLCTSGEE